MIWHLYARCSECGAEAQEPCRDEDDRVTEVCETRTMLAQKPLKTRAPRKRNRRECVCGRRAKDGDVTCGRRLCRDNGKLMCFFCGVVLDVFPNNRPSAARPKCSGVECKREYSRLFMAEQRRKTKVTE